MENQKLNEELKQLENYSALFLQGILSNEKNINLEWPEGNVDIAISHAKEFMRAMKTQNKFAITYNDALWDRNSYSK